MIDSGHASPLVDPALDLLAQALHCAAENVPDDATLGHPPAWDSIGHMRLVLSIEERIGRMLSAEEIVGLDNVSDISRLIAASHR